MEERGMNERIRKLRKLSLETRRTLIWNGRRA